MKLEEEGAMSSVPEEFYLEILARLPVKSLLRCKSVCKTWFKLISDSSFVKFHLNLIIKKNDPSLIIAIYHNNKTLICSTNYHSLISSSPTGDLYDNSVELDYPFKSIFQVGLVGSCDGLVCLFFGTASGDKEFFFLWNPATTEYKEIPELPKKNLIGGCAFGYDYKAEDYMLVSYSSLQMEIAIYTLRSNLWKVIKTDPYKFWSVAFVNGTFHWLARPGRDYSRVTILSLDISKETFVELQPPREAKENNHVFKSLGALGGCLSVLVDTVEAKWEVWVMQNYGVRESWIKCHVIPYVIPYDHSVVKDYSALELLWSFNGDFLFRTGGKIVVYDTVHAIARERPLFQIEKYIESLVSLNSGTYVKELMMESQENAIVDDA